VLGDAQITMIVEYLHANDIHAVAIESSALEMITGANSVGRIMVPEEEVGEALDLLEPEEATGSVETPVEDEEDEEEEFSTFDKAVLGATAVIMSPIGAAIGYVIARTFAEDEVADENETECPICGTFLELSDDELDQRWYTCPECENVVPLEDFVVCPTCQAELVLDAREKAQGWFICPDCRRAMRVKHY